MARHRKVPMTRLLVFILSSTTYLTSPTSGNLEPKYDEPYFFSPWKSMLSIPKIVTFRNNGDFTATKIPSKNIVHMTPKVRKYIDGFYTARFSKNSTRVVNTFRRSLLDIILGNRKNALRSRPSPRKIFTNCNEETGKCRFLDCPDAKYCVVCDVNLKVDSVETLCDRIDTEHLLPVSKHKKKNLKWLELIYGQRYNSTGKSL